MTHHTGEMPDRRVQLGCPVVIVDLQTIENKSEHHRDKGCCQLQSLEGLTTQTAACVPEGDLR